MSIDVPVLPESIKYSSDSFHDLREAEAVGRKGNGAMTPYFNMDNLKHFSVKVDGYDGDVILDLDTSKLFLGTLLDPSSGTDGGTYPYAGDKGEIGGPTLAWPLRFHRVHFYGTEGGINNPAEYYTYFLCGQPVKVNNADPYNATCESDNDEEELGVKKSWNSSFDADGNYSSRTIIGGGRTGHVITEISIISGNSENCNDRLVVNKGIAFLLSTGGEYETHNIGYSNYTIQNTVSAICESLNSIDDSFNTLNSCIGGGLGVSGCDTGNVCGFIDTIVDCLASLSIASIDCDSLLYCP